MITTSDMEKGLWISLDDEPWLITSVTRHSPTSRNATLIVKVKLKNPRNGLTQDKSFRGGDKVEAPDVDERKVSYLYAEGSKHHFMDSESYEQFFQTTEDLGEVMNYLQDGLELTALKLGEEILGIRLPNHVDLVVTETPPPIKTSGSGSTTKPATTETGLVVQVPPYLETGEKIRVDTRDGRFVQRVKE